MEGVNGLPRIVASSDKVSSLGSPPAAAPRTDPDNKVRVVHTAQNLPSAAVPCEEVT